MGCGEGIAGKKLVLVQAEMGARNGYNRKWQGKAALGLATIGLWDHDEEESRIPCRGHPSGHCVIEFTVYK